MGPQDSQQCCTSRCHSLAMKDKRNTWWDRWENGERRPSITFYLQRCTHHKLLLSTRCNLSLSLKPFWLGPWVILFVLFVLQNDDALFQEMIPTIMNLLGPVFECLLWLDYLMAYLEGNCLPLGPFYFRSWVGFLPPWVFYERPRAPHSFFFSFFFWGGNQSLIVGWVKKKPIPLSSHICRRCRYQS